MDSHQRNLRTISREVLVECIDSIYGSYGVEGDNLRKTGYLVFKERQARANIYREILGELKDPVLFAFFAYLSLADGTLFYEYFDNELQQKVECTAPHGPMGDDAALERHATFAWMHDAYLAVEFNREEVKTPEFWMRFVSDECEELFANYQHPDPDTHRANATTEALRALRQYLMEKAD